MGVCRRCIPLLFLLIITVSLFITSCDKKIPLGEPWQEDYATILTNYTEKEN